MPGPVRIWHEERGRGAPLLMIQGLGYDHGPYSRLRDGLCTRMRTIVLDNRGVGRSDKPEGDYSIGEMAQDAVDLLDRLGIDRAFVLGVSLGGYVAQTIALDHRARVRALVLGCTYMTGDPGRIQMPAATLELLTSREGTPEELVRRGLAAAFASGYPEGHPDVFEQLVSWRLEHPVPLHGYMGQLAAGLAFDASDRVGSISCPVLVLHGDADAVVPVERAPELAAAIPGARLEILEGAGHLFFIEEAELTARLVADFIEGQGA